MGKINLPYLNTFQDRYHITRYYYRRDGKNIPLSAEDLAGDYVKAHLSFETSPKGQSKVTFGELVDTYLRSNAYEWLRPSTQWQYQWHLNQAVEDFGDKSVSELTRKLLLNHRDSLLKTPVKANARLRILNTLLNFAVERELMEINPIRGCKSIKVNSDGWKQWSDEALNLFKAEAKGSPRIAFHLALYTGQRRADVLGMKWRDISKGIVSVRQQKTGVSLSIPVHPLLEAELVNLRCVGQLNRHIVCRLDGKPYTPDGFGMVWEREQKRVGVFGNPFHGLRKNAVSALFEAGCTPQEVMAITGHTTLEMINHYGKGANQKRLAQAAMDKLLTKEG